MSFRRSARRVAASLHMAAPSSLTRLSCSVRSWVRSRSLILMFSAGEKAPALPSGHLRSSSFLLRGFNGGSKAFSLVRLRAERLDADALGLGLKQSRHCGLETLFRHAIRFGHFREFGRGEG
jgi:hypothetical protein